MNAAITELLSTPEGRDKLVASMSIPIRCGGSGYGKQGRYLIRGGVPYYGPTDDYHSPLKTQELNHKHGFESPCEVYERMTEIYRAREGRRAVNAKQWTKDFIHNCVVHPMLPFLPTELGDKLHDRNGKWAFPQSQSTSRSIGAVPGANPSSRYTLHVEAGVYESDTLPGLLGGVLRHRFGHWRQGHGWVD